MHNDFQVLTFIHQAKGERAKAFSFSADAALMAFYHLYLGLLGLARPFLHRIDHCLLNEGQIALLLS